MNWGNLDNSRKPIVIGIKINLKWDRLSLGGNNEATW
jgi:hypothetical protein